MMWMGRTTLEMGVFGCIDFTTTLHSRDLRIIYERRFDKTIFNRSFRIIAQEAELGLPMYLVVIPCIPEI